MLLSLCTPVMNRTHDLRRTMAARLEAASCPPVELCIVDYNSTDDLEAYIDTLEMPAGVTLTFRQYRGEHKYWHMAHGFNLSILASAGEYFCLMGADTYPETGYFEFIRQAIADGCTWMEPADYMSAICCRRAEWLALGGYDERFEFYGPDDRDMALRLTRSGGKKCVIPRGLVGCYFTPDAEKIANYRIPGNKSSFSRQMRAYYRENDERGVVVANQGREWGQWN